MTVLLLLVLVLLASDDGDDGVRLRESAGIDAAGDKCCGGARLSGMLRLSPLSPVGEPPPTPALVVRPSRSSESERGDLRGDLFFLLSTALAAAESFL